MNNPDSVAKAFGLLYYKQGMEMMNASSYKQAIYYFRRAEPYVNIGSVFNKRDRATLNNAFGKAYYYEGAIDSARARFELAAEHDSLDAEAYNNIGYIAFLDRNYDRALVFYQKALAVNPRYETAKENIELIKRFQSGDLSWDVFGLFEKAEKIDNIEEQIDLYTKMIQASPLYSDAYNNLAVALFYSGDYDQATKLLEQLTVIDPNYAMGHNNLGFLYLQQDRFSEAIEQLLIAVSLKEKFTLAFNNVASAYYMQGEYQRAKQFADKVLDYEPYNVEARRLLTLAETMLSPQKATHSR
ncbi:MAG: tetratricopeptide repeat protein [Desulfobulbaceae bacterium]|nr:tetratricopeptide repeat protein [Desulfobulbaceae bacterium]